MRRTPGHPGGPVAAVAAADRHWRIGYARIVVPVSAALTTGAVIVAIVAEYVRR